MIGLKKNALHYSLKALYAILTLIVVGCAEQPIKTQIKTVYVPVVEQCQRVVVIKKPVLPIEFIDKNSSYSEVVTAYVQSVLLLQTNNRQLRELLAPFSAEIEHDKIN